MSKIKFDICWIGYCEATNKVWGWFTEIEARNDRSKYIFFAHIGHTIVLKKHNQYGTSDLDRISKQKIANKYVEIKFKNLIELWPDFMTELNNKFIFDKFAEKI